MNEYRILTGDVREQLKTLPDGCVQTCVTSPPYWGLRDYGTAQWSGGDAGCSHAPRAQVAGSKTSTSVGQLRDKPSMFCKCGAQRIDSQLGLEPTPDEFVRAMVEVFSLVRRVLAKDGTCWVNMGDAYAGSWGAQSPRPNHEDRSRAMRGISRLQIEAAPQLQSRTGSIPPGSGLKAKDLVGVPWMLAFALRSAGWYLRADIVWSKPNPMPESVQDRPTKAHEYIFLLSKSAKYYYNGAAIREPYAPSTLTQFQQPYEGEGTKDYAAAGVQNPSDIKRRITDKQRGHGRRHAGFNDRWDEIVERRKSDAAGENGRNVQAVNSEAQRRDEIGTFNNNPKLRPDTGGANKRSVWHVATQPYPEAHFATYPEKLIEPCILAGSRPGDTVLDPFTGSGTTGAVALRHQRNFIGCELNPAYVELARKRMAAVAPLFSQERTA